MTHQYSTRELYSLIIPLIADSFLSILIGMADTVMVSSCGEAAVSGVSLVDSVSNLLINLFSAFSTGGAVVVSQYLGRGDEQNARKSSVNLIYISALISIALTAVMLPLRGQIIDLFFGSIDGDVRSYADDYFVPILISYPFLALYTSLTALSRAENKSFRTLEVSALMNVMNIGGNAILIYVVGMGAEGAGISSLISRIAGFAIMFAILHRNSDMLSINGLTKGPFDIAIMKRILRIGVPAGLEGTTFHIGKLLVQSLIATLGTSAMAINAVATNFNAYSNIPGNGINLAMITIIGQCRGRRNFKDITYYTKYLMILVYITTAMINLPFLIFTPQILSVYGMEAASLAEALPICRLCLIACSVIWPIAFSIPSMLKAVGDVRFILFASFASMWIFRVGGSYLMVLAFGMGVEAIWYAMYLDWMARGILFIIRVMSGRWRTKEVI